MLTLEIESQCQSFVPHIAGSNTPYYRQFPAVLVNRNRVLGLRLDEHIFALELHLALKHSAHNDRVLVPRMEELRTVTQPHIADAHDLVLNSRIESGLGEGKGTRTIEVTPHIVEIGTEGYPVTDIKTETAVYLTDVSASFVLGLVVVAVIAGSAVQGDGIADRAIGQHTHRGSYPLLPDRHLDRHIFEVTVGFVAMTGRILIATPVDAGCYVHHERECVASGIGRRLRRVDGTVVTHTKPYSAHTAESCRDVLIEVTICVP